jgi:hypothetical protein
MAHDSFMLASYIDTNCLLRCALQCLRQSCGQFAPPRFVCQHRRRWLLRRLILPDQND